MPIGVVQNRISAYEFLPAALEVIETPPSPIGRSIGIFIILVFCGLIGWACWARVDIVATAEGKIDLTGRSKVVQPFETGVVRAIHVQDGQRVAKGDTLVELDGTTSVADTAHVQGDLLAAQVQIARLKAALSEAANPVENFVPPANAPAAKVATQRQLLIDQTNEQRAKLAELDRQAAEKDAEREAASAGVAKVSNILPLLRQQVGIRKTLFDDGLGSRITYLQVEQDFSEHAQELKVQKGRQREAENALAAVAQARAQAIAEYRGKLLRELAEAEQKADGFTQDLVKATERHNLQLLSSPVDGIVQQLAVHTIGGVVTPAQQLMVIVPATNALEIEAQISNRDIGFVQPGQEVAIKVETFNYTQYGLLHGVVRSVSQDAILRDRPSQAQPIANGQSALPDSTQELIYMARISLDRTDMNIDDRAVKLMPGMAVAVEIKTGSRTVIRYILSPLLRFSHESLHER